MEEQVKKLELRSDGIIEVHLKKIKDYDDYVYTQISNDPLCLDCMKDMHSKLKFYYDTNDYFSLQTYLSSHLFDAEECIDFLIYMFEFIIKSNMNKPLCLQTEYMFMSYREGAFKFLSIPLIMDRWLIQDEQCKMFICDIIKELRVIRGYDSIGYLVEKLKSESIGLPQIMQGLLQLKGDYKHKKRWFERLCHHENAAAFIIRDLPKRQVYITSDPEKETHDILSETMVLFANDQGEFIDVKTKQIFPVSKELFTIGRNHSSDLCINDHYISANHAVFDHTTGVLKDLSSNGTFVNGVKIKTKKLKNADTVSFADHTFEYFENNKEGFALGSDDM